MGTSASSIPCPTCGAENGPQARYCSSCGVSVTGGAQEPAEPQGAQAYGLHRCALHADVETGLACGKCGKYICPRCMIQTPVGSRCRECARVSKHPTFDVPTPYYLRSAVAGGVTGVVGGVIWGLLLGLGIPFLPWLAAIAVGYVVGEAISAASNRKRGTGLAVVAAGGVSLAIIVMLLVAPAINYLFLLLFAALAYYIAVVRVR